MGGLGLALLELALEWIFTKHLHALSKLNFLLILVLGLISLWAHEGIWFKLQPFFTGLFMGGALIITYFRGGSFMYEMVEMMQNPAPPKEMIRSMELHVAIFLIVYGIFMAILAIWSDTPTWTFFKTIGLYLCFGVFMLVEMIYQRMKMKKSLENQMKAQILKQTSRPD